MFDILQPAHGGWRGVRLTLVLCAVVALGASRCAQAHNVLGEYVQHGIHLTVGAQHIDITVDLTFFEQWSSRERGVMDADGSGAVTRAELESYLKRLAPQLSTRVKLRVAGRELPLIPLYDPEVDLLADDKVGPAHHRLRLFFFAPTPELNAGDVIVIEDSLWPEAKAIATPQTEGHDGCKLRTLVSVDASSTSARAEEKTGLLNFRCLQPPSKPQQLEANSNLSAATAAKSSPSSQQLKPSPPP